MFQWNNVSDDTYGCTRISVCTPSIMISPKTVYAVAPFVFRLHGMSNDRMRQRVFSPFHSDFYANSKNYCCTKTKQPLIYDCRSLLTAMRQCYSAQRCADTHSNKEHINICSYIHSMACSLCAMHIYTIGRGSIALFLLFFFAMRCVNIQLFSILIVLPVNHVILHISFVYLYLFTCVVCDIQVIFWLLFSVGKWCGIA